MRVHLQYKISVSVVVGADVRVSVIIAGNVKISISVIILYSQLLLSLFGTCDCKFNWLTIF